MRWFVPALAALSACASARSVVSVGDRTVSGARFEPYDNLWNWSFVDARGATKRQGTWSDRFEIETATGAWGGARRSNASPTGARSSPSTSSIWRRARERALERRGIVEVAGHEPVVVHWNIGF